jgi:hypothetical protein
VPPASTRRQDAPLVELSGDSPHAGEPLRPQVSPHSAQVGRAVLCVRLVGSHGLLVADLFALERSRPVAASTQEEVISETGEKEAVS